MDKKGVDGEIDLMELLARFYAAIKRNIWAAILFPVIGAAIGFWASKAQSDLWSSSMLVETTLLTDRECKFLVEELEKVGEIPGLSNEMRTHIKSVTFTVIPGEPLAADESRYEKSVYLQVTIEVDDESILPMLNDVMLRFINVSHPVQRHRKERTSFYSDMIAKLDQEIAAMDEVKKKVGTGTQATYLNPSELYSETVALHKERLTYKLRRDEVDGVHLVKGFDQLMVKERQPGLLYIILGAVVGIVMFFVFLFVRFFFSYYHQNESRF